MQDEKFFLLLYLGQAHLATDVSSRTPWTKFSRNIPDYGIKTTGMTHTKSSVIDMLGF